MRSLMPEVPPRFMQERQHDDIPDRSPAADCNATRDAATSKDDEFPTSGFASAPTRIS
jgi:hypothetical protein